MTAAWAAEERVGHKWRIVGTEEIVSGFVTGCFRTVNSSQSSTKIPHVSQVFSTGDDGLLFRVESEFHSLAKGDASLTPRFRRGRL